MCVMPNLYASISHKVYRSAIVPKLVHVLNGMIQDFHLRTRGLYYQRLLGIST